MDPADAYVYAYDTLSTCPPARLNEWHGAQWSRITDVRDQVRAEVLDSGSLPDRWMPDPQHLSQDPEVFGVLLGLDRALLNADPSRDDLDERRLGRLRARLERHRRLNLDTDGALLFRRTRSCRPRGEKTLDDQLHLIRIPEVEWRRSKLSFVPAQLDLEVPPDSDSKLMALPPLTIAQLPMLAESNDLVWEPVETSEGSYYSVKVNASNLRPYLRAALDELDRSGAEIAVLPEASLDNELLTCWQNIFAQVPRPDSSRLTWILIGTGPVTNAGPYVSCGDRQPNRAVIFHRRGEILLTQDKQHGFTIDPNQQQRYRIHQCLGGNTRDEFIMQGHKTEILEAHYGRFAVLICEDASWIDLHHEIVVAGVSHALVPVLAPAMYKHSFMAQASMQFVLDGGITTAVSNSLAIDRYVPSEYQDGGQPAPTLLVASPLTDQGDEHTQWPKGPVPHAIRRDVDDARTDALTARVHRHEDPPVELINAARESRTTTDHHSAADEPTT